MKSKKSIKGILILLITVVIAAVSLSSCYYDDGARYPRGRDTAVYVGDGRFQIAVFYHSVKDKDGVQHNVDRYGVVDGETDEEIEPDVQKYYDNSSDSMLYLIGGNGYTVIHYDTGKWIQEKNIEAIAEQLSSDEFKIFENCGRFQSPA